MAKAAHDTVLRRYCRSLLDAPHLSALASLQYTLLRPLSMLMEIATLTWRNYILEGCCCVGEHADVVGPTVDQVTWAYGEVQSYFEGEGTITCSDGMTVLDVGAHIGLFALEVMRRTHNTARVYCLEPLPRTSGFLRRNVAFSPSFLHKACV